MVKYWLLGLVGVCLGLPYLDLNGAASGRNLQLTFNENQKFLDLLDAQLSLFDVGSLQIVEISAVLIPRLDANEGLAAAAVWHSQLSPQEPLLQPFLEDVNASLLCKSRELFFFASLFRDLFVHFFLFLFPLLVCSSLHHVHACVTVSARVILIT